jgi:hypothetical protein
MVVVPINYRLGTLAGSLPLAAFAFTGPGLEKTVRWFLAANGLIMPFIALQTFCHPLIWGASAWAVMLPGATIFLLCHLSTEGTGFDEIPNRVCHGRGLSIWLNSFGILDR